jgi:hypothetical protein
MDYDNSRIALEVRCPVLAGAVTLRFVRFFDRRRSHIVERNCSELERCTAVHGKAENIPGCLLYKDW